MAAVSTAESYGRGEGASQPCAADRAGVAAGRGSVTRTDGALRQRQIGSPSQRGQML